MLNANLILKSSKICLNKIKLTNFVKKPFFKNIVKRIKDISEKNKNTPLIDETSESDSQLIYNNNNINHNKITNLDLKFLFVSYIILL
jgi:hypothetical protein